MDRRSFKWLLFYVPIASLLSCKGEYTCVCKQSGGAEQFTIITKEKKKTARGICEDKADAELDIHCLLE